MTLLFMMALSLLCRSVAFVTIEPSIGILLFGGEFLLFQAGLTVNSPIGCRELIAVGPGLGFTCLSKVQYLSHGSA
jgi:hypothetical protein